MFELIEEAIDIAIKKEKEIEISYEVVDIDSSMDIIRMNGYAYLREKEYKQYYKSRHTENYPLSDLISCRVEDRIIMVWKIELKFKFDSNNEYNEDEFTYYIDCETGEVVGGE